MNRRTLLLLCTSLPAATAAAQPEPSVAPFGGTPTQLSLSQTSVPGSPNALLKCEGFEVAPPVVWPAGPGPSFDLDFAFRNLVSANCSLPTTVRPPDVDAMSLGLDWVLADANGRAVVPAGRWGAITFSVGASAMGVPGSAVAKEAVHPDGPGGDVFSFILPGSVVPAYLVARTHRALDRAEIGIPVARADIDGLDQFIPLYRLDPVVASAALGVPAQPTLYFSVSNATLASVPAVWWGNLPPSGASILQMTWNLTARRWGCVSVWKSFRDLGLEQCEDIDALALDLARNRMLFSTRIDRNCTANPRPQLLFVAPLADDWLAPVEYSTSSGGSVTDAAGLLRSDEVDAVCSLDPFAPLRETNNPKINTMRVAYGTPEIPLTFPGVARTLEGTSFLACWPGAGPAMLTTFGWGWPGAGPAAGFGGAFLTVPPVPMAPIFLGALPRNPAAAFAGDPLELSIPIPAGVRMLVPALRVAVTWVAIDSGSLALGQAHRVGIDL